MKNKRLFLPLLLVAISLFSACANPAEKIIWQKEKSQTIYLTFDDGPDPVNTPIILDILKKYKVKATFFVLGHKVAANPAIVKRMVQEGHALGNHTYNHINGYVVDEKIINKELDATHRIIFDSCGINVKLFRPPYGFFNWRAFKVAKTKGYTIVLWTFDLTDWKVHSANLYIKTVKENLTNGAIILMHDGGSKRKALIEALPKMITYIKKRGYRFDVL